MGKPPCASTAISLVFISLFPPRSRMSCKSVNTLQWGCPSLLLGECYLCSRTDNSAVLAHSSCQARYSWEHHDRQGAASRNTGREGCQALRQGNHEEPTAVDEP